MTVEKKIAPYRKSNAKIFTDRDNGVNARMELELDAIDAKEDEVIILIPSDTWGINPSFFGGLFEGSIKKYGVNFRNKYHFKYSNGEEISESLNKDIDDDIDHVLRRNHELYGS